MSSKKIFLLFVLITILSLVAAQCASAPAPTAAPKAEPTKEEAKKEEPKKEEVKEEPKKEEAKKEPKKEEPKAGEKVTVDTVIGTEPRSFDPSKATENTSIYFIRQMFLALTAFDEKANVIPSLATEWKASADGLKWTFKMRSDIHWVHRTADGKYEDLGAVKAQDVVYGVRRTLDPATASEYAFVLYLLQGAEEFNTAGAPAATEAVTNTAVATPTVDIKQLAENVGVKAIDDTTVEFTLKQPAGYFPNIAALWIASPMPQKAIEQYGEQWTEAGNIVTNGPYTLKEWQHQAAVYIEKNPLWVDAAKVQIDVFGGPINQEASTAMAMYEKNDIDVMADPGWGVPLADLDRVKGDATLSKELTIKPRLCNYYYGFINTKPPFDNPKLRKAFSAAIDRKSLIKNVTKGEQRPAHSFAPPGIFGTVADNKEIGAYMVMENYADQVKEAQKLITEAGYPDGAGLNVKLMHNTSEDHAKIAQAIQAMWQEAFPKAKLTIENQEFKVFLDTLLPGAPDENKPDIYRMGWCADYPDSNNWLNDVFNSKSVQNYSKFLNPEFDKLVEQAAFESDPAKRLKLYEQAEKIMMDDNAAIAPIYYYTYVDMFKPWIKAVRSPMTGDPIDQWTIDIAAKKAARGK